MDAIVSTFSKDKDEENLTATPARPSREEAEAAVRTLIRWTGDNPDREGLLDTPQRVVNAYREMFSGYDMDPHEVLGRTFEEVAGYDDIVLVKDIAFHSHCEHHMVPIIGKAHVAYLPDGRVLGLSKIARVVDIFAQRLQTQESITAQIASTIDEALSPPRCRGDDRGGTHVHGDARNSQAGLDNADDDLHRCAPQRSAGTGALHFDGARSLVCLIRRRRRRRALA